MQQNDWFNSLTRKFSRNARWKQKKQTFHLFVFVGLNILLHYFDKITFFLSLGEFLEGEISGKSVFPSQRSTWSESKFVLDEKKSLFVPPPSPLIHTGHISERLRTAFFLASPSNVRFILHFVCFTINLKYIFKSFFAS